MILLRCVIVAFSIQLCILLAVVGSHAENVTDQRLSSGTNRTIIKGSRVCDEDYECVPSFEYCDAILGVSGTEIQKCGLIRKESRNLKNFCCPIEKVMPSWRDRKRDLDDKKLGEKALVPTINPLQEEKLEPTINPLQEEVMEATINPLQENELTTTIDPLEGEELSSATKTYEKEPMSTTIQSLEEKVPSTTMQSLLEEALSTAIQSLQEEALSTTMQSLQEEVLNTTIQASQEEAPKTTIKPIQEEDINTTIDPLQGEALNTTMQSLQEEALSTTIQASQEEALKTTIKPIQEEDINTTINPLQGEALSTTMQSLQEEALSTTMQSLQEEALSTTMQSLQEEALSTTIQSLQEEALNTTMQSLQEEELSTTIQYLQEVAQNTTMQSLQEEELSTTMQSLQEEALSTTMQSLQEEALSTTIQSLQGEALNATVHPQQEETLSPPIQLFTEEPGCGVNNKTMMDKILDPYSIANDWPWMAVLLLEKTYMNFCGGVLINRKFILSAAHCFTRVSMNKIVARLGEYDFSTTNDSQYVDYRLSDIIFHSEYTKSTQKNDIALLKLNKPVEYTAFIQPICLPKEDVKVYGMIAIVIGWGQTSYGGKLSNILREVTVPIWHLMECQDAFIQPVFETNICAASYEGGRDSCLGDSGGPLMIQREDGRWTNVGIVSWGINCGQRGKPGIYTLVPAYIKWIAENSKV